MGEFHDILHSMIKRDEVLYTDRQIKTLSGQKVNFLMVIPKEDYEYIITQLLRLVYELNSSDMLDFRDLKSKRYKEQAPNESYSKRKKRHLKVIDKFKEVHKEIYKNIHTSLKAKQLAELIIDLENNIKNETSQEATNYTSGKTTKQTLYTFFDEIQDHYKISFIQDHIKKLIDKL